MRKALLPFILLLVLLALLAVNQLLANQHYVLAGETGAALYTATFDDYLDDWHLYQGRLEAWVEDSQLQVKVDRVGRGAYSKARPHFGDFDYRVEARAIGGPLNNGYGVIFRLQDKDNDSFEDDSYYAFLVSSDGYYQVLRAIDGEQKELSTWLPSPLVHQGVGETDSANWLRVIARGNRFQFFINGEPVALCLPDNPDGISTLDVDGSCMGTMSSTLTDDSVSSGQIGVIVFTYDPDAADPTITAGFDNVLVLGAPEISEQNGTIQAS